MSEHLPWIDSVKMDDLPELYRVIAEAATGYLSEDQAVRLTLDICYAVQGQPYIAKPEDALRHLRDRYIHENHDGFNYDDLAKDTGLTPRRVRQIINGDERQVHLFEIPGVLKK